MLPLEEVNVMDGALWPIETGQRCRAATYRKYFEGRHTFKGRLHWWWYHCDSLIESWREVKIFQSGDNNVGDIESLAVTSVAQIVEKFDSKCQLHTQLEPIS